jgi:hypothetical protein
MIDADTTQLFNILLKHRATNGSGFLMHRDGMPAYPGTQDDFAPPPSFVRFLRLAPMNLLSEGAAASGSKEWETFAVAFYQDGLGNAYFFDTRHRHPNGEYSILLWSHDDPKQDATHMQTVALDFPEWLAQCVRGTLAKQVQSTSKKGCLASAVTLAIVASGIAYLATR